MSSCQFQRWAAGESAGTQAVATLHFWKKRLSSAAEITDSWNTNILPSPQNRINHRCKLFFTLQHNASQCRAELSSQGAATLRTPSRRNKQDLLYFCSRGSSSAWKQNLVWVFLLHFSLKKQHKWQKETGHALLVHCHFSQQADQKWEWATLTRHFLWCHTWIASKTTQLLRVELRERRSERQRSNHHVCNVLPLCNTTLNLQKLNVLRWGVPSLPKGPCITIYFAIRGSKIKHVPWRRTAATHKWEETASQRRAVLRVYTEEMWLCPSRYLC